MSNVVVEGGTPVALTSLDQLTDKAKVQLWPTPRDMLLLIMPNGFVNESRKLKCTATDLADLVKQVQQSLGLPAESYMSHVVADGDIPVALVSLDQLADKAKVQVWGAQEEVDETEDDIISGLAPKLPTSPSKAGSRRKLGGRAPSMGTIRDFDEIDELRRKTLSQQPHRLFVTIYEASGVRRNDEDEDNDIFATVRTSGGEVQKTSAVQGSNRATWNNATGDVGELLAFNETTAPKEVTVILFELGATDMLIGKGTVDLSKLGGPVGEDWFFEKWVQILDSELEVTAKVRVGFTWARSGDTNQVASDPLPSPSNVALKDGDGGSSGGDNDGGATREMMLLVVPNGFVKESRKLTFSSVTDLADLLNQTQTSLGLPSSSFMSNVVKDGRPPVALTSLSQLTAKARVQMWSGDLPATREIKLFVMPNSLVKGIQQLTLNVTALSDLLTQTQKSLDLPTSSVMSHAVEEGGDGAPLEVPVALTSLEQLSGNKAKVQMWGVEEIASRTEAAAQYTASTHIQAIQRGKQVREGLAAQSAAATKIQAVQRGKLGRAALTSQREAATLQPEHAAATRIQALHRGQKERKQVNELKQVHAAEVEAAKRAAEAAAAHKATLIESPAGKMVSLLFDYTDELSRGGANEVQASVFFHHMGYPTADHHAYWADFLDMMSAADAGDRKVEFAKDEFVAYILQTEVEADQLDKYLHFKSLERMETLQRKINLLGPAGELVGRLFDVIDADDSGDLDESEAYIFFRCTGCQEDELEYFWADLVRLADADGDGEISKAEFVEYIIHEEDLDQTGCFTSVDRERELKRAVRQAGPAGQLVSTLFQLIDIDSSDVLDEEEAKAYFAGIGIADSELDSYWQDLATTARSEGMETPDMVMKEEFMAYVLREDELDHKGKFISVQRREEIQDQIDQLRTKNFYTSADQKAHEQRQEEEKVLKTTPERVGGGSQAYAAIADPIPRATLQLDSEDDDDSDDAHMHFQSELEGLELDSDADDTDSEDSEIGTVEHFLDSKLADTAGTAGTDVNDDAQAPNRAQARRYPVSPDGVTREFLSSTFGLKVASFEVDASNLEAGVLADAFLVTFKFEDTTAAAALSLPTSCFFKVTKGIDAVAEMASNAGHVYEKEVYFYKTLSDKVSDTVRIPTCYGVFADDEDPSCREFCLVMECLDITTEWRTFDQFKTPMDAQELESYLDFIAGLHACTWDLPIDNSQIGLGVYYANWHPLNEGIVGKPEAWTNLQAMWQDVYGQGMLDGFADPGVKTTMQQVLALMTGPNGVALDAEIMRLMRTRPRSLTHGDARGNNVFCRKDGSEFALIDWQMWAAGPCANEWPQIILNSFTTESGIIRELDYYIELYYKALCKKQPKAAASYSLAELKFDIQLLTVDMHLQYLMFTVGVLPGYQEPANKAAADNWEDLLRRNAETVHMCGCLEALSTLAASLSSALPSPSPLLSSVVDGEWDSRSISHILHTLSAALLVFACLFFPLNVLTLCRLSSQIRRGSKKMRRQRLWRQRLRSKRCAAATQAAWKLPSSKQRRRLSGASYLKSKPPVLKPSPARTFDPCYHLLNLMNCWCLDILLNLHRCVCPAATLVGGMMAQSYRKESLLRHRPSRGVALLVACDGRRRGPEACFHVAPQLCALPT